MGLFDRLAGSVLAKVGGEQGSMAKIALDLFNQHGGLHGVLDKFKASGLDEQVASWISRGDNLPVSPAQVCSVFGDTALAAMAAKLALSPEVLASLIADNLPKLVDKMTPNGEIPADAGNLLGAMLSLMK
jgi:uncharacterized protein YidB (DUF937 family)